jgi:hypothetical protein
MGLYTGFLELSTGFMGLSAVRNSK